MPDATVIVYVERASSAMQGGRFYNHALRGTQASP